MQGIFGDLRRPYYDSWHEMNTDLLYRRSQGGLMGMFHESWNTKVASFQKIDRHRWT